MNGKSTAPHERAVLHLARKRGLLHTRDVAALGVPTVVLTRLTRAGKLERAGRGIYTLAADQERPSFVGRSSLRVPRGVICLLSALRVHGSAHRRRSRSGWRYPQGRAARLATPKIRVVRMSRASLTAGRRPASRWKASACRSSTPPRPLPTASSFATRSGSYVALEALREGWRERKFAIDDVSEYARVNRVANVMRPYPGSAGVNARSVTAQPLPLPSVSDCLIAPAPTVKTSNWLLDRYAGGAVPLSTVDLRRARSVPPRAHCCSRCGSTTHTDRHAMPISWVIGPPDARTVCRRRSDAFAHRV